VLALGGVRVRGLHWGLSSGFSVSAGVSVRVSGRG